MGILFLALTVFLIIMSLCTYMAYARDKKQATLGGYRLRERTLLILSACFGAPGALIAMRRLRHKTLHSKFTISVPLMLGAQLAIWAFIGVRALITL